MMYKHYVQTLYRTLRAVLLFMSNPTFYNKVDLTVTHTYFIGIHFQFFAGGPIL